MAATWGHCLALLPHTAAGLSSPHSPFPPPPLFLFGRVYETLCPALSVRRLVGPSRCLFLFLFRSAGVTLGSVWVMLGLFWVNLGHFGSVWVTLGRIGHLGLARDSWALALFFLGKPQFFGVPPCYFNVDLACLCTCMFLVCMGVCRGRMLLPIEPCVYCFYKS